MFLMRIKISNNKGIFYNRCKNSMIMERKKMNNRKCKHNLYRSVRSQRKVKVGLRVQVKRKAKNSKIYSYNTILKILTQMFYSKWLWRNLSNLKPLNLQDRLLLKEKVLLAKRKILSANKSYNLTNFLSPIWKYYSQVHQEIILNHSILTEVNS